jgi:hypothetical protein
MGTCLFFVFFYPSHFRLPASLYIFLLEPLFQFLSQIITCWLRSHCNNLEFLSLSLAKVSVEDRGWKQRLIACDRRDKPQQKRHELYTSMY